MFKNYLDMFGYVVLCSILQKGCGEMNVYISEKTDAELIRKIKEAAKKNNRSVSFIIRDTLEKGLKK